MPSVDLWPSIRYFVDKGITRRRLLADLQGEGVSLVDAGAGIEAALSSGQLTLGTLHGNTDWVVVTEFLPRTAMRLRANTDSAVIYDPMPEGPPPIEGGLYSADEVVGLTLSVDPVVRRLAQEVLRHRWAACEADQGSE
jgi:hypothetical protein